MRRNHFALRESFELLELPIERSESSVPYQEGNRAGPCARAPPSGHYSG
ncbi:hypothetical protein CNECB9_4290004 [Cupriavidus necator]|uniref:Uncharacterized protein n=1 Tax=Cupriavidus necator TaxID=106590 RepID=A0A1K0JJG3_CUPNE|nr:hypothetical protein CNECB9_4290004 [Cupriavidus necator]